jgi:site-specific recombinase XerD
VTIHDTYFMMFCHAKCNSFMINTLILNVFADTYKISVSKSRRSGKGQKMIDMEITSSSSAIVPIPLEVFVPPISLNGEQGSNRASQTVVKQIDANNDLQAIQTWLLEFAHSPQTLRTYRKEAERLLLWAIIAKKKPFSSLSRDDLRDYQLFLADPQPRQNWCGLRRPRNHPNWRPFTGPLTQDSAAHAITIINALFNYLVEAGYLSGNPLGLMRRKLAKKQIRKEKITERFLEKNCWDAVLSYIENLPREQQQYERIRYLFYMLYLLGLRVNEVASAKMSDIKQIRGRCWLKITGKGQKTNQIPINLCFLSALIRYREFYGLTRLPLSDEESGLFMNITGKDSVSDNMIYRLVKKIFLECAKSLEISNPEFAVKLKKASTHWLRHTSITHQADAGIELRYIKRNARHESVETTMLYQHVEEEKWHDAMSAHQIDM